MPGLNGLGQPNNAALGTFTQVAPDGLTPFVAGDRDMTSWAAEISLDVSWAHAIAPKANITLVLAKSDNDAYAIADETAGYNLGFINMGLYHIGQAPPKYSSSFHDVTSGNNPFLGVSGFSAVPDGTWRLAWDRRRRASWWATS